MAPISDAVYATLLMNDAYLPGAMVLGHSLKDRGAKGKLVALVVIAQVSATTITELKTVWDEIAPVQQIMNSAPGNLYLMNRPDLISAFTKIQLWKQTQYKRIVYMDADVVALRAPNELLTMDTDFAAVPDIGWPDCFNSGVMVLNPNMADYYALLALAERGISFDGADQGLLNMHFTEWEKLGFKYNCTPSGNYQYVPAFRHFQSSITLIHFIGRDKPWMLGRTTKANSGVYGELLARWWAVYDKHYRAREIIYYEGEYQRAPIKLQDLVAGEETLYLPAYHKPPPVSEDVSQQVPSIVIQPPAAEQPLGDQPTLEEQINSDQFEPTPTSQQRRWSAPHTEWEPTRAPPPVNSKPEASNFPSQIYDFSADVKLFQPPPQYPDAPKDMWYEVPEKVAPQPTPRHIFPWEERAPKPTRVFPQARLPSPPIGSPVIDFGTRDAPQYPPQPQQQTDNQQQNSSQFHQPQPQPQPQPEPRPKQIFPWEARQTKATRVFTEPRAPSPPLILPSPIAQSPPEPKPQPESTSQTHTHPQPESNSQTYTHPQPESTLPTHTHQQETRSQTQSEPHTEAKAEEAGVIRDAHPKPMRQGDSPDFGYIAPREPWVNPWEAFKDRSNAWDDMPEITKYVQALQPPKRGAIQILHHTPSTDAEGAGNDDPSHGLSQRRESVLITDFPTANERPSLPVTPAPIRRPTFWGDEKDLSGELPNAEGVPNQIEWVRRFSSYPTPAFTNVSPLLHELNGVLCLKCQYCGKQNPIAKLEELQRRQSQAMLGKEMSEIKEPPKRELPESATKEAVEAAVEKVVSPVSARPLKPILKEPHFELSSTSTTTDSNDQASFTDKAVTDDAISPTETRDVDSDTPTPTNQAAT